MPPKGSESAPYSQRSGIVTSQGGAPLVDFFLTSHTRRQDRRMGDKSAICEDPEPLGRIVLGLYGDAAPATVANFLYLVRSGLLQGTTFQR